MNKNAYFVCWPRVPVPSVQSKGSRVVKFCPHIDMCNTAGWAGAVKDDQVRAIGVGDAGARAVVNDPLPDSAPKESTRSDAHDCHRPRAHGQFNNPETKTCVRRDTLGGCRETCGIRKAAICGRNLAPGATNENCRWSQVT